MDNSVRCSLFECWRIAFDRTYTRNPLVNVMGRRIVKKDNLTYAKASNPGSKIIYVGSSTGKTEYIGANICFC